MSKTEETSSDAYQIKITLAGSKPPIWRRFVAPANITLDRLHDLVQVVMGWTDSHLHAFYVGEKQYTTKRRDGIDLDVDGHDERKFRLCDVAPAPKSKVRYEYDFGDSWEHLLLVEKIIPPAEKPPLYCCLTGAGQCPPEDCGGIWGYYHLLEVLGNPKDEEHADMLEWTGGPIEPAEFDLEEINKSLVFFRTKGKRTWIRE
ncbi:MAG: plasmid pRiA4b ORF-3 family protein [Tepidisphaeraceae bacterium]|jgi:hypothetical protein